MWRFVNTPRGGSRDAATAPIYIGEMGCPSLQHQSAPSFRETSRRKIEIIWEWAQLVLAYGILEVALWTRGHRQQVASLAFISWIFVTTVMQWRRARGLGIGVRGFGSALIAIPIAAIAAGTILLAGRLAGTLRPLYGTQAPLFHAAGYATWAMVQEFILNSYFFVRLERLLRSTRAALWGAVLLFTLAHVPNPVLLAGTFVAAIFFVSVFQRYRNVYPLGIAHAMLGLAIALTVPDTFLHHMRVGISYFHFVLVQ